jgi:hypothetical protein
VERQENYYSVAGRCRLIQILEVQLKKLTTVKAFWKKKKFTFQAGSVLGQVSLHNNVDCVYPSLNRLQRWIPPATGVTVACLNKSYAPWNYHLSARSNILPVKALRVSNVIVRNKYANCTYAVFDDASQCHYWHAGECIYSQNAYCFTEMTMGLTILFLTASCTVQYKEFVILRVSR